MLKQSLAALAAVSLLTLAACSDDSDSSEDAKVSDTPTSETPSEPAATTTESADAAPAAGECTYATDGQTPAREVDVPPATPVHTGQVEAVIATTVGDLPILLDADGAPCTVNSFVSLAEQGYYDETPCPRLASSPGFVLLQCGDPSGTGAGGPGYSVEDEFDGSETYPAGTIAMANTGAPDTNGSQFFLCIEDTQLPPSYTVFGTVQEDGIKVLAEVAAKGDDGSHPAGGGKPVQPVDITEVTIS